MAVDNPCMVLQGVGATHASDDFRMIFGALLEGALGSGGLISLGGVHPHLGGQLAVSQTGSPSMAVLVANGLCVIPGTESAVQGSYMCLAPTSTTLSISAANPSLARIDIVVAKVQDSIYSGATDAWSLAVVTGTPAGSPVAPAAPSNSLILAQVAVAAGATQIVNANITDVRRYCAAVGGTIKCTSSTHPTYPYEGQRIYETNTNLELYYDGSDWIPDNIPDPPTPGNGAGANAITAAAWADLPSYTCNTSLANPHPSLSLLCLVNYCAWLGASTGTVYAGIANNGGGVTISPAPGEPGAIQWGQNLRATSGATDFNASGWFTVEIPAATTLALKMQAYRVSGTACGVNYPVIEIIPLRYVKP